MHRRAPLLLALLLLAACGSLRDPTATPGPTAPPRAPSATLVSLTTVSADEPRMLGDPAAPVTMIEYSDFECPYCATFVRDTMPALKQQYIDTGVVRLVYRDYLLDSHPSALISAIASRCAGSQGRFWEMHDELFATHGVEWGYVPNRDRMVMIEMASRLGLDQAAFESCLGDPAVEQAVREESNRAESLGLSATPTFVVNNLVFSGARPLEEFHEVIKQALEQGNG